MAADADTDLEAARQLVQDASNIVVLTGAGISTDSGIPDFRGPDGLWTKNPGAEEASYIEVFRSSASHRKAFWRMMLMMRGQRPKPNPGHLAVADLERQGKLLLLVTQNVDGLHQDAGSSARLVVEVHGGTQDTKCLECGEVRGVEEALGRVAGGEEDPGCRMCGGVLKANVVLFGEELPVGAMDRVLEAARQCDLLICVGSTLSVYPVAEAVPQAIRHGAKLIIINQGETAFDEDATVLLPGSISKVLPALIRSKL